MKMNYRRRDDQAQLFFQDWQKMQTLLVAECCESFSTKEKKLLSYELLEALLVCIFLNENKLFSCQTTSQQSKK